MTQPWPLFATARQRYHSTLQALRISPTEHVLIALLGEKILVHCRDNQPLCHYPFSFSKRPLSCQQDSLGTPWGLHAIAEKHGDGCPHGAVFSARRFTGQTYAQRPDAGPGQPALVTTRILRLRGLEPGLNAGDGHDSFDRFIYIHGTNFPDRFPENLSAGCLLMLDEPLVDLFAKVPLNSHVLIFFNNP